MVQIIDENKRPSFMQSIMGGIADNAGEAFEKYQKGMQQQTQNKQSNQMASQLLGFDTTGLDPKTRDQLIMQAFRQQGDLKLQEDKFTREADALRGKKEQESHAKIEPLRGAMDVLNRMKALRKKGSLGVGSSYSPFESTRKDAGEYSQLGKSLIQYATNIPIRNKLEFETLAHDLYDPNITDAAAEGILNSMERIINNALSSAGYEVQSNSGAPRSVGANRRPLSSFSIGAQ